MAYLIITTCQNHFFHFNSTSRLHYFYQSQILNLNFYLFLFLFSLFIFFFIFSSSLPFSFFPSFPLHFTLRRPSPPPFIFFFSYKHRSRFYLQDEYLGQNPRRAISIITLVASKGFTTTFFIFFAWNKINFKQIMILYFIKLFNLISSLVLYIYSMPNILVIVYFIRHKIS